MSPAAAPRQAACDTGTAAVASDRCELADLATMCEVTDGDRRALVLTAGWSSRWVATWKVAGRDVACPVADMLVREVELKVEAIPEVSDSNVELVWDPPWGKDRMSEVARMHLGF